MTEFFTVKIGKKSYLVCREKSAGKGRPVITAYCEDKSPAGIRHIRRKIEKAIVEARHG